MVGYNLRTKCVDIAMNTSYTFGNSTKNNEKEVIMKSNVIQEFVEQVFSDEDLKARFLSNTKSILSQFSLSPQEEQSIIKSSSYFGCSNSGQLEAAIEPKIIWT